MTVAVGDPDRSKERRAQIQQQRRVASEFRGTVEDRLHDLMSEIEKEFEDRGDEDAVEEAPGVGMQDDIEQLWRRASELAGRRIIEHANAEEDSGAEDRITKEMDDFRDVVESYIKQYAAAKVSNIDAATRSQLRRVIRSGTERGLSTGEISDMIRERKPSFAQYRAARIARTEAHQAHNVGAKQAARTTSRTMVKEWIAGPAEGEYRTSHNEHDGERADLEEAFVIDGAELDTPGDPAAAPEHTVNCRCAVGYRRKR